MGQGSAAECCHSCHVKPPESTLSQKTAFQDTAALAYPSSFKDADGPDGHQSFSTSQRDGNQSGNQTEEDGKFAQVNHRNEKAIESGNSRISNGVEAREEEHEDPERYRCKRASLVLVTEELDEGFETSSISGTQHHAPPPPSPHPNDAGQGNPRTRGVTVSSAHNGDIVDYCQASEDLAVYEPEPRKRRCCVLL